MMKLWPCFRPSLSLVICGYCGVDYQFQMYDGVCGRWIPVRSFVDLDEGFEYCRDFDFKEFYRTYIERFV